jgi:hypothetical protein
MCFIPPALQQAEALVWLKARDRVMYALSAVFASCIGVKLTIDYYQASRPLE